MAIRFNLKQAPKILSMLAVVMICIQVGKGGESSPLDFDEIAERLLSLNPQVSDFGRDRELKNLLAMDREQADQTIDRVLVLMQNHRSEAQDRFRSTINEIEEVEEVANAAIASILMRDICILAHAEGLALELKPYYHRQDYSDRVWTEARAQRIHLDAMVDVLFREAPEGLLGIRRDYQKLVHESSSETARGHLIAADAAVEAVIDQQYAHVPLREHIALHVVRAIRADGLDGIARLRHGTTLTRVWNELLDGQPRYSDRHFRVLNHGLEQRWQELPEVALEQYLETGKSLYWREFWRRDGAEQLRVALIQAAEQQTLPSRLIPILAQLPGAETTEALRQVDANGLLSVHEATPSELPSLLEEHVGVHGSYHTAVAIYARLAHLPPDQRPIDAMRALLSPEARKKKDRSETYRQNLLRVYEAKCLLDWGEVGREPIEIILKNFIAPDDPYTLFPFDMTVQPILNHGELAIDDLQHMTDNADPRLAAMSSGILLRIQDPDAFGMFRRHWQQEFAALSRWRYVEERLAVGVSLSRQLDARHHSLLWEMMHIAQMLHPTHVYLNEDYLIALSALISLDAEGAIPLALAEGKIELARFVIDRHQDKAISEALAAATLPDSPDELTPQRIDKAIDAIIALYDIEHEQAIPLLYAAVDRTGRQMTRAVVETVSKNREAPDPRLLDALIAINTAPKQESTPSRNQIFADQEVSLLARYQDERLIPLAMEMMTNDGRNGWFAVRILTAQYPERDEEAVRLALLSDPHPVRRAVALGFRRLDSVVSEQRQEEWYTALRRLLSDHNTHPGLNRGKTVAEYAFAEVGNFVLSRPEARDLIPDLAAALVDGGPGRGVAQRAYSIIPEIFADHKDPEFAHAVLELYRKNRSLYLGRLLARWAWEPAVEEVAKDLNKSVVISFFSDFGELAVPILAQRLQNEVSPDVARHKGSMVMFYLQALERLGPTAAPAWDIIIEQFPGHPHHAAPALAAIDPHRAHQFLVEQNATREFTAVTQRRINALIKATKPMSDAAEESSE